MRSGVHGAVRESPESPRLAAEDRLEDAEEGRIFLSKLPRGKPPDEDRVKQGELAASDGRMTLAEAGRRFAFGDTTRWACN